MILFNNLVDVYLTHSISPARISYHHPRTAPFASYSEHVHETITSAATTGWANNTRKLWNYWAKHAHTGVPRGWRAACLARGKFPHMYVWRTSHAVRHGGSLSTSDPAQPAPNSVFVAFVSFLFFFFAPSRIRAWVISSPAAAGAHRMYCGGRIDNNNTHSCTTRSSAELSSSGADHARKSHRNVLSLRGISYAKGATNNRVHCSICMLPVHLLSYVSGEATDIVLL